MEIIFEILDTDEYPMKLSVKETGKPITGLVKEDFSFQEEIIDLTEIEPNSYFPNGILINPNDVGKIKLEQ